eukprot:GFUD01090282.1.p1 GENE.GFUD01090282.1~~GFUD01090282.1.p1  ORF type:complete len:117 (-),score=6.32 GFUD01090282.1:70-378(-)
MIKFKTTNNKSSTLPKLQSWTGTNTKSTSLKDTSHISTTFSSVKYVSSTNSPSTVKKLTTHHNTQVSDVTEKKRNHLDWHIHQFSRNNRGSDHSNYKALHNY